MARQRSQSGTSTQTGQGIVVGDVFAFAFAGQVGLCRVIAAERPRGAWDKNGRWSVVTCEWLGPRGKVAAALRDKTAIAPLRLTRLRGTAHVQSIGGPPPAGFKRVGHVEPSAADRGLRSPRNPGAWQWIALQVRAEREFRADPGEARAKSATAARERTNARRRELAELRRAKRAPAPARGPADAKALGRLARTQSLAGWREHHDAAFVRTMRAHVADLARTLARGPALRTAGVVSLLAKGTRGVNRIDAAHEHAITTPDAEDLVELLVAIGTAAGLTEAVAEHTVERHRDF